MNVFRLLLFSAFVLLLSSCSVLKTDTDAEARRFLNEFQLVLNKDENEILKLFNAKQSKEVLLSVIRVLKNTEDEFITCEPQFAQAQFSHSELGTIVSLPVLIRSQKLEEEDSEKTSLTLWLSARNNSFSITKVEGEKFYESFMSLKGRIRWEVERIQNIATRKPFYDIARKLENSFDSVIWFTNYLDQTYFYVVSGTWDKKAFEEGRQSEFQMGLADKSGELLLPIGYDLIGTLGFVEPNLVEVRKDGKLGYFDVKQKNFVIPIEYDLIIPYSRESVKFIVKRDSAFGWVDSNYTYAAGFPNADVETWVKEFQFIPKNFRLDATTQGLLEIPRNEYMGNGMLIIPSYLSKTGIFKELEDGISTAGFPFNAWTEYVETKGTAVKAVTESISALIATIQSRYIEGREEFYAHNKVILIGPTQDTLSVTDLYSATDVSFKLIDQKVLEIQSKPDETYYWEGGETEEMMPLYRYVRLNDDLTVLPLLSKRSFPQTEFVKLDSSYIVGIAKRYDEVKGEIVNVASLSPETLKQMRNEILAFYGFRFSEPEVFNSYKSRPWYNPKYVDESQLETELTEIDRHNLHFLKQMIELVETGTAI